MIKMYDNFSIEYNTPFGAIKVNEEKTIRIKFPKDQKINDPYLVVFPIEKWDEQVSYRMEEEREENGFKWYNVRFSISKACAYYYFFRLTINGKYNELRRKRDSYENELNNPDGWMYNLTVYENTFIIDDEYLGGIMYQIFIDRFCNSGSRKLNVPSDRVMHEEWGESPYYKTLNNDYYGGDIQGVIQKLDYLKGLGVKVIYLNPIFEAHSNHRYNTANYMVIDILIGTLEEFKLLCKEAKKRGIVIVLDGVFNHNGCDSIYFNKEGRYGIAVGAYRDKNSKYRDWYNFTKYPDEYASWWGIMTVPEVNQDNTEYVEYICGENGVIQKWIKAGAYGFRLDVIDNLKPKFLDKIKEAVVKYGGKIVIGEVWEDATTKKGYEGIREYLLGKQVDSVMNYPFMNAIVAYVRYHNSNYFYTSIMEILERYPKPVIDKLMNHLGTHDTVRVITKLVSEELGDHENDREWQAARNTLSSTQYEFGKKLLKLATTIQYFLPGVPSIYYGDEAGAYGYRDPFNRGCYPWKKEDNELIDFFKKLGKIRIENSVFKKGSCNLINVDEEICIIERFDENDSIIVALNISNNSNNIYDRIPNIEQYEQIAQFGNYDNYWLHAYSSVIFKKVK